MGVIAGFQPANVTLYAPRNGVLRMALAFSDNDTALALDLTGWSARMQLRASPGAASLLLEINTTAPTAAGSVLTLTDAVNGTLEIFFAQADLAALPAVSPVTTPLILAYDLVLTEPGGDFDPYLTGAFVVPEGVTR